MNITVNDFTKLCRFCMSYSDTLKTIFKNETSNIEINITKMFTECLNLHIDRNAELPLFICCNCTEKLLNCYQFRNQCINSTNRLTEIWQNEQHINVTEQEIKKENTDNEFKERLLEKNELEIIDDYRKKSTKHVDNETSITIQLTERTKRKVGRPKKSAEEKIVKTPEMCQICGGLYIGLKYHMFVHDETPKFECDYCGKKFKHKSNVFAHVRIHANDRKHQCPHCPYKFQDRAKFLRHLKIHTGERNFNCDLCEKAFCRRADMLKHRLIHDVPRVPCPYCEKMFTTKTNLLSHVGIHTGERKFKCETCGAAFVASSSLSNHRKIHKKENPVIQCKECGLILADTAMLKNHMRDHQNVVMLD